MDNKDSPRVTSLIKRLSQRDTLTDWLQHIWVVYQDIRHIPATCSPNIELLVGVEWETRRKKWLADVEIATPDSCEMRNWAVAPYLERCLRS